MKNAQQTPKLPELINADEFMRKIVTGTPELMRQVDGVVNVDVTISIDEHGRIESVDSIHCNTVEGWVVHPENPEIIEAARSAVAVLRFRPARHNGEAVSYGGFQFSFAFTTAALDYMCEHQSLPGFMN